MQSINLVVAHDGFLCVMDIIHILHSGYLDYSGGFQTALLYNELNLADREG